MTAAHLAIVLAAGGSTRLGQPKQLLTRDGETLVHRVVRLLIATAPIRTIVVVGAHQDAMTSALRGLDVVVCVNAAWTDGLSASLRTVASTVAAHVGPTLLTVCDQPALDIQHLHALLIGASGAVSRIAATRHGGARGTPVVVPGTLLCDWSGQPMAAGVRDVDARDARSGRVASARAERRGMDDLPDAAESVASTASTAASTAAAPPDRGLGVRLRDVPEDHLFLLDAPELRFDIDTPHDLQRAIDAGLIDRACAT